ncbi:hypothetical protein ACI1US_00231 [Leucobacter sp. BZR 635]
MRYVLAIVALAISGVLLLLGIGQRTFLAGPAEIAYSVGSDETAAYAVLDVSELEKVDGQANLVMRGESTFSALANTRDAAAWLEPFDHVELTIDPATKSIVRKPVAGVAPTTDLLEVDAEGKAVPLDPRGSDLWLEERSGSEAGTRMAVTAAGDQSIIIAGADAGPIPKGTAVVWVQDRSTPWAGPLLAAGGLFAALGAVLYLIAFDRDKRALGPRRGRKGPLIGVRNLFGGSKRRRTDQNAEAPKRGSLDNTPDAVAPGGAAAGAAGAVVAGAGAASLVGAGEDSEGSLNPEDAVETNAETLSADDEEIVTAEVVDEVLDEADSEDVDAVDGEVLDGEVLDEEAPDTEVLEGEALPVDEESAPGLADDSADNDNADADSADADSTDAGEPADDAETVEEVDADLDEGAAAKQGDDDAE